MNALELTGSSRPSQGGGLSLPRCKFVWRLRKQLDLLISRSTDLSVQSSQMSLLSRLPTEPLRLISLHLGKRVETCLYSTSASVRADKKAYSHTLRLPKTSLPLKHKVPVDVEAKLRHKISDELYIWQVSLNSFHQPDRKE